MIFVDSSFWLALRFRDDRHHGPATTLWRARAKPLLTSNQIVGETWTFMRRFTTHADALETVENIASSRTVAIARIDAELESDAWTWLRRRDEREYSFVDATSFALMRQLDITEALAFDADFTAAGFTELRP